MKKLIIIYITLLLTGNIYSQNDECDRFDVIGIPTRAENPAAPLTPTTVNCPPDCPPPPPQPSDDDERIVFWIHGFGGDYTALSKASAISTMPIPHDQGGFVNDKINYPARKIISNAPSYGTGLELIDYGSEIGTAIKDFSEQKNQSLLESKINICITSSWGGNVTRMAEKTFNSDMGTGFRAGGIVSIGGSHDGAVLADNIITTVTAEDAVSTEFSVFNGTSQGDLRATIKLNNFLRKASDSLLEGPKHELLANKPVLSLFENDLFGLVDVFVDQIIDIIPKTIGTSLFTRTALELHTTNPTQLSLQANAGLTANVAGFGVEDYELGMWRLFYWGKTNPNNIPTDLPSYDAEKGQGFFEATSDKFAEDVFNRNLANYEMKVLEMQTQFVLKSVEYDRCLAIKPLLGFLCNPIKVQRDNFRKARDGYSQGIRWFEDSSDFWELLTGALEFNQEGIGTCICEDLDGTDMFPCVSAEALANIDCAFKYFEPAPFVEERFESDGVVLASSAMNFPGAILRHRMDGSNHFQVRNDEKIKDLLLLLFTGNDDDMDPINFFKTPERS